MKRKIVILFVFVLAFSGCTSSRENGSQDNSTNQNEGASRTETFEGEYFVNFTTVQNMIQYLGVSSKEVTMLHQTDTDLAFCFKFDNMDESQEKANHSYKDYIQLLEDGGYKITILDATISQTILLEKDNCTISITDITNIEEWKKDHKNEIEVDKINDENIVYEIKVKK